LGSTENIDFSTSKMSIIFKVVYQLDFRTDIFSFYYLDKYWCHLFTSSTRFFISHRTIVETMVHGLLFVVWIC